MTDAQEFGLQLERARTMRGWSQKELASRLGPGGKERTIQAWEAGERMPRGKTLARLRVILPLEGTEGGTRSEWPRSAQKIMTILGNQLATLSHEDLRQWRRAFIGPLVVGAPIPERNDWPDDAETIVDIVGQILALGDQAPPTSPNGLHDAADRA